MEDLVKQRLIDINTEIETIKWSDKQSDIQTKFALLTVKTELLTLLNSYYELKSK